MTKNIFWELLHRNVTITADVYCHQLGCHNVRKRHQVLLQHDSVHSHSANFTIVLIYEVSWEVLPHPPCSPNLAPSDFHLCHSLHSLSNNIKETSLIMKMIFKCGLVVFFYFQASTFLVEWKIGRQVIDNAGEYVTD